MTGVLLDTHVLLWASAAPERLGPAAAALLVSSDVEIWVSAVSAAEIAIKRSIGKLEMSLEVSQLLPPLAASELDLTVAHGEATSRLPPLHRDPFDRLLLAQAVTEGLTLLTADEVVLRYPVAVQDARH